MKKNILIFLGLLVLVLLFFPKGHSDSQVVDTEAILSFQTVDKEVIKNLASELGIEDEAGIEKLMVYDFVTPEESKAKKKKISSKYYLKKLEQANTVGELISSSDFVPAGGSTNIENTFVPKLELSHELEPSIIADLLGFDINEGYHINHTEKSFVKEGTKRTLDIYTKVNLYTFELEKETGLFGSKQKSPLVKGTLEKPVGLVSVIRISN